MNFDDLIFKYVPLWCGWEVDSFIGSGSLGKVYKVFKRDFDQKYFSAVKFIEIPTSEQRESISSYLNTNDPKITNSYFEDIVEDITKEIELLYKLKESGNIINYEDHLIKKVNSNKWHVMIRMEYAQSLNKYIMTNKLEEENILNLGIDICSALEFCHNKNILHRDIKESNIFVLDKNSYKLGDFSVSKERTGKTLSKTFIGTIEYMPPEVFNNKPYDETVDIYSLGIVLYKLLNNGRMPFLPEHPEKIMQSDIEYSNS